MRYTFNPLWSCNDFYPGYPYSRNCSGIEIVAIRFISLPQKHTFGMYQSPNVSLRQMRQRLHPDWNTSTLVDNSVFSFETLREKNNFSLSPSRINGSGLDRLKIKHFRSLRISKILHQGKFNQRVLFHRLFFFYKM